MLSNIVRSRAAKALHPLKVTSFRGLSYTHNLHQPPAFYVNGIKHINDYDIEEYRPQIRAFLTKRRTVKREVPPKVAIMKDLGEEY